MTQEPLVSIIVPVYNAKDTIVRCIDSITKQTYKNIEILLINDGSPDVSGDLCAMYANKDPRIVYIDKENSGVSATRNEGMRRAKGEFFQFVDADDSLQPYATELLVKKALSSDADLVIAHYNRVEPPRPRPELPDAVQGTVVEETMDQWLRSRDRVQSFGFLMEGPLNKEEFAYGLLQEPASFYYGVMWNKLYRASIIREHEDIHCNEEMGFSEDFLFNLSFIRYAEKFYALSTPIYNYIQNPNSIVHKISPIKIAYTKLGLMEYYTALYKRLGLYEENKLRVFKYFFDVAEM